MNDCTSMPVFLNRLKFHTATGDFRRMEFLTLDCFLFRFDPPLEYEAQYELIEYMERLGLRQVRDVFSVAIWLAQHRIPFRLTFKWLFQHGIWYNIVRLRRLLEINRILERHMDQVMAYNLNQ